MERKKLAELVLALLIAATFVSSYVSLSNYAPKGAATTTIPQTVYAQGNANGIITGYGSPILITVACPNSINENATIANVSSVLTSMENNNSVSNVYNANNNFQVASGTLSSYSVYSYFKNSANATRFNCLNVTGPARIALPSSIYMTIGSQSVNLPVNASYQNASISMSLSKNIGTQLKLRVSVLVTVNGTFYGPMTVSLAQ